MGCFHKGYQNKETDHYQLHIWSYHGSYAYMADPQKKLPSKSPVLIGLKNYNTSVLL